MGKLASVREYLVVAALTLEQQEAILAAERADAEEEARGVGMRLVDYGEESEDEEENEEEREEEEGDVAMAQTTVARGLAHRTAANMSAETLTRFKAAGSEGSRQAATSA